MTTIGSRKRDDDVGVSGYAQSKGLELGKYANSTRDFRQVRTNVN